MKKRERRRGRKKKKKKKKKKNKTKKKTNKRKTPTTEEWEKKEGRDGVFHGEQAAREGEGGTQGERRVRLRAGQEAVVYDECD